MKEIKTNQGDTFYVDDEDYEMLCIYKWTTLKKSKYAISKIGGKLTFMHRFLMNPPKGIVVDHIDGNGLNNQRSNLRLATRSQNLWNSKGQKNRLSKYKGVIKMSWKKKDGTISTRWRAQIKFLDKEKRKPIHYYYYFKTETEAAEKYNELAKQYYGEFAVLNNQPQSCTHKKK